MRATAVVYIRGGADAWKAAEPFDLPGEAQKRVADLEIQGSPQDGYYLVMSPAECMAADNWHATIEDAQDTARRLFGLSTSEWR